MDQAECGIRRMAEIGAREVNMRMLVLTAIHIERLAAKWDEAFWTGEEPETLPYNVPANLSVCALFDAQAEPGWREHAIAEGVELGLWPIE